VSYEFDKNKDLLNVVEIVNGNEGKVSTRKYVIDVEKGRVLD
jgi:hypothetical protein